MRNDEDEKFVIRAYDKAELASLYCPGRTYATATKTLSRWINSCVELARALAAIGYNPRRHRFLRQEVELIVKHLGEP